MTITLKENFHNGNGPYAVHLEIYMKLLVTNNKISACNFPETGTEISKKNKFQQPSCHFTGSIIDTGQMMIRDQRA